MIQKSKTLIQKQKKTTNRKIKPINQDHDSFQLKMLKMQKQIALLNMDIQNMLEEKVLKQNIEEILIKERKNLQSTFLYQDLEKSQSIQTKQKFKSIDQRNKLSNINSQIKNSISMIESTRQLGIEQTQQKKINIECQSKHLKQIFNPEDSINTKEKSEKLRQKLSLMYQKIQSNLQTQQPYLHEKILQRIKRQAKKYSRTRLLNEIQILIKQNSQWMNQQTNKVNSKLQQQSLQQMCVANLGIMKKIMGKKVNNNDFIYENYSSNNTKVLINQPVIIYPVEKIREKLLLVLKIIEEIKIQQHLKIFTTKQNNQNKQSIKQILKDPIIQKLISSADNLTFQNQQQQMLKRLSKANTQLQNLIKS